MLSLVSIEESPRNNSLQVFDILVAFPPHESITAMTCSGDTPLDAIFPSTMPFKISYSVYALKTCLEHQLQNVGLFTGPPASAKILTLHRALQLRSSCVAVFGCWPRP